MFLQHCFFGEEINADVKKLGLPLHRVSLLPRGKVKRKVKELSNFASIRYLACWKQRKIRKASSSIKPRCDALKLTKQLFSFPFAWKVASPAQLACWLVTKASWLRLPSPLPMHLIRCHAHLARINHLLGDAPRRAAPPIRFGLLVRQPVLARPTGKSTPTPPQ